MSSSLTLYEITDTLPALLDTLDMATEEQRPEIEAEIQRYMSELPRKVDGITRMLAHFDAMANLAADEIKRLQERKKFFERRREQLEKYVVAVLEKLPETKLGARSLNGATSSLSLRACPPSVAITNQLEVPARFVTIKQEFVIDKRAVKEAIEAGENVPGAALVTGKHALRIG